MDFIFRLLIFLIGSLNFLSCVNSHQNKISTKTDVTDNKVHKIPDFKVTFPKTEYTIEKTEDRVATLGNILVTNWILQGADRNGPFMYFVAHNEVPSELKSLWSIDPKSLDVSFQAMLTSSAIKLGGTNFNFTKVKYKNFEGMESICKVFDGEGIIKSRVYRINDDLFIISAGGQNISIDSVDKFIFSFDLKY